MSYPPSPGYPQDPNAGYGYGQYPQQGMPGYGYGAPAQFASWGARVGATLIDSLIGLAISLPFLVAGMATESPALVYVGYIPSIGFYLWQLHRQGTTGATIGKKYVGIRVVREADGQYTGFGMAFVRMLAHILDALPCYLGYLWPLWDEKKQTFADKICGTLVIR
ncbi:RDD family protein [Yinghuangia soli]|uniref:RDD family protein n=1 Tax=Yinghuangia soli TaxID=2908204 RepID=A0AA41PWW6_9ACTN|nr:RDD family protein [Yinghuangia soli]MCF2527408.1 RDD family protein [Yinghuangia soli]